MASLWQHWHGGLLAELEKQSKLNRVEVEIQWKVAEYLPRVNTRERSKELKKRWCYTIQSMKNWVYIDLRSYIVYSCFDHHGDSCQNSFASGTLYEDVFICFRI